MDTETLIPYGEISHERCQQLLGDAADIHMSEEEAAAVRRHLFSCTSCSVEFADKIYEAMVQGRLPKVEAPPLEVPESIRGVFSPPVPSKHLFDFAVDIGAGKLPKWEPEVVIDRRSLEHNEYPDE